MGGQAKSAGRGAFAATVWHRLRMAALVAGWSCVVAALCLFLGCSGAYEGARDGGGLDSSIRDANSDVGSVDGGTPDAGPVDPRVFVYVGHQLSISALNEDGVELSRLAVPHLGDEDYILALATDRAGRLHATVDDDYGAVKWVPPSLYTFEPSTRSWQVHSDAGWRHGGVYRNDLATYGDLVFASAGSGPDIAHDHGLLWFDTRDWTTGRDAMDVDDPRFVVMGGNGTLYLGKAETLLYMYTPLERVFIAEYIVRSMEWYETIAVAADHTVYGSTGDHGGENDIPLRHLDGWGRVISEGDVAPPMVDLTLVSDGRVVGVTELGEVGWADADVTTYRMLRGPVITWRETGSGAPPFCITAAPPFRVVPVGEDE